jgi:hypothetical protein
MFFSAKPRAVTGLYRNGQIAITRKKNTKDGYQKTRKNVLPIRPRKKPCKALNSESRDKYGGLILTAHVQNQLYQNLNLWKEMKPCKNCLKEFQYITHDGFCESCVQILSNRQLAFEQKKRIEELETAIEAALKIKSLWLPPLKEYKGEEYYEEYQALYTMERIFKQLLEKESDE